MQDRLAWLALVLTSWGLPAWMLLRYLRPTVFAGDDRESPALAVVLAGLAVALLADTERGAPLYLSLLNLGLVLVYLFHASSVHHGPMPDIDTLFPRLQSINKPGDEIRDRLHQYEAGGALVIIARGSFCGSSRKLVAELAGLEPALEKHGAIGVVLTAEPADHWTAGAPRDSGRTNFLTVAAGSGDASTFFVEPGGVPLWVRLLGIRRAGRRRRSGFGACRPSLWLVDRDGYVLWRHLPANYRQPGDSALLRAQLSRLEPDD
ncbi:hypothetical protein [Microbulbifer yueqingensis]|uniref:hypothetical protein n=1 Tax=Microbulbifer yueqingensis TaxID=658219 RepID=UPI000B8A2CA7|nr:hypothetical protein [Microbulbifer yueqingensis]